MKTTGGVTFAPWQIHAGGVLAALGLALVAHSVLLKPLTKRHAERDADRANLNVLQREAASVQARRERLNDDLIGVQSALSASTFQLEPLDQLNTRVGNLASLAEEAGLVIQELQAGESESTPWFDYVPIIVSGSASYPACTKFLHLVHEQLPDVKVMSFELSGNPGLRDSKDSFWLNLAWYAAPRLATAE